MDNQDNGLNTGTAHVLVDKDKLDKLIEADNQHDQDKALLMEDIRKLLNPVGWD